MDLVELELIRRVKYRYLRCVDLKLWNVITGAAFYEDRYVRCDNSKWRIARTGYTRIYEASMSLDDLPSWKLTANRWAA